MGVLDRAVEHFDGLGTGSFEVPEWVEDGKPCVIYHTAFTVAEKKKLYKFAKEDDLEFLVRVVILKALDKNGEKLFDVGDKVTLMNRVSSDIIERVAGQLNSSPTMEDQLGN